MSTGAVIVVPRSDRSDGTLAPDDLELAIEELARLLDGGDILEEVDRLDKVARVAARLAASRRGEPEGRRVRAAANLVEEPPAPAVGAWSLAQEQHHIVLGEN
jgi:hypothetical protein